MGNKMDFIWNLIKIYSILFFQIMGSTLFSTILLKNDIFKEFTVRNPWFIIGFMLGSIITLFCLSWKRYHYPLNFYLLALFTLLESCSIGTIGSLSHHNIIILTKAVSFYNNLVVLEALVITTGIFLGLTLFTWQNKYDFSSIGGYLYFGFMFLLSEGLVFLFFPYNR
ncbi:hypothetical protein PCK2_000619 [Pneumocystis canis]|nr:hypothetical protein PCK2_000619 [Pneumocystis canis]